MAQNHALVRSVPASFAEAIVRAGRPRLDPSVASQQHLDYQHQLVTAGYKIEVVPTDEGCPDCVFIEDTAVIIGSAALITRPGAPSRRRETGPVAAALQPHFPTVAITEPGTIDGGDVFTLGGTVYVGRSQRTNREGIEQLWRIASGQGLEIVTVGVYDTLHLKSAVLPIDQETVVVTPEGVEEEAMENLRVIYEDKDERYRFSALPLVNGNLLTTATAPRTTAALAAAGYRPIPIDISELQAADGGLTCLSILF